MATCYSVYVFRRGAYIYEDIEYRAIKLMQQVKSNNIMQYSKNISYLSNITYQCILQYCGCNILNIYINVLKYLTAIVILQ